jgi:2'-5' RNA ligase
VAVPVGPPAHDLLAARIEGLRQRVAGVRWVDTATTHVTLHFFAELPLERLGEIVTAVGGVVAGQAPFTLRPAGYGSFPGGARARVLWLGLVEESGALAGLAAGVQAAVAGCGFEVDPRPFRPHVTLGRPGPRFDLQAWRCELAEPVELPAFTATEILLYESRNGHHVRERLPFGVAAGGRGASVEGTTP